MEKSEKYNNVRLLLEKHVGRIKTFHEGLRIGEDLKLYGDDVSDLLKEYSEVFDVDISKFPFDDYFASEGFNPIDFFTYLFGGKKLKTLYVRDLIRGIEEKRLL